MDLDDGEVQAPAWDLARIRGDLGAICLELAAEPTIRSWRS